MATAQISWLQVGSAASARVAWLRIDGAPSAPVARLAWLQIDGSPEVVAPAAPSAVTGTATGASTALLSFTDNSGSTAEHVLQIRPVGGAWATAAGGANPMPAGVTSFSATGLTPSLQYQAQVLARRASLDSAFVASAEWWQDVVVGGGGEIGGLPELDTIAPVFTGAVTASAITSTSYTLAWPAATDAVGVTGYEVSLTGGVPYPITLGVVLTTNITGRTPEATDSVSVRAFDAAGSRSAPLSASVTLDAAPVVVDATAPTLAGTITTSTPTSTSYTATCPAATDDTAVTGYQYRLNAGTWVTISAGGRTAVITGRTAGAADALEMRAFDAAGNFSAALSLSVALAASAPAPTPAAQTGMESFIPFMALDLPGGIPYAVTEHHIRQACIEFFQKSLCWQQTEAAITIAGSDSYTIPAPTGSVLVKLLGEASVGGSPVDVCSMKRARSSSSIDTASYIWTQDLASFFVSPMPVESGVEISIAMVLKPSQDSVSIPASMFEQYAEGIASGALARLLAIKGRAWTNERRAAELRTEFEDAIGAAANAAATGFSRAPFRVTPQFM